MLNNNIQDSAASWFKSMAVLNYFSLGAGVVSILTILYFVLKLAGLFQTVFPLK